MIDVVNVLDVIKNIHIEEDKIEIYSISNIFYKQQCLTKKFI